MTLASAALGCKVNQYEANKLASALAAAGFRVVPFGGRADVYLINTCCVTAESEAKSRKLIRRARRLNPDALIAVTGCYAEMDAEAVRRAGSPDLVVGNTDKPRLPEIILQRLASMGRAPAPAPDLPASFPSASGSQSRTRAVVKVQDGCDQFCSYCIIPYARGPLRSVPADAAAAEMASLCARGYREIVLTGIHLTRYGVDLPGSPDLTSLLARAEDVAGLDRVRLGSMEPGFFTPARIRRVRTLQKLCPHFHISLQSGCDRTLSAMRRGYTAAEYRREAERLYAAFPDCALTTDVIVGFPGETEADFQDSFDFVDGLGFAKIHVFPFSPRAGTPAADMPQVDASVKSDRVRKMLALAKRAQERFLARYVGRTLPVLFERAQAGEARGHTANYIPVTIRTESDIQNQILPVRLTSCAGGECKGELLP